MSVLFNGNLKHCASCAFWGGPRDITADSKSIRCARSNDEGICNNAKSSFKKKNKLADYSSCNHYTKWQALK